MWYVCALGVLLLIGNTFANDDPVVRTPKGSLRGVWKTSRSGRQFQAFLGVPYAKPPIEELRFEAPEPVPGWNDTREANTPPPTCIQTAPHVMFLGSDTPFLGVEDCLYISVYTSNPSAKVPVLVHFHGGGFTFGASSYYGAEYVMDEDIVAVTANYRVGIYGFLSFETPEWPGNQGMKDQVQVLRWVQENIASFGGDPNQVTIIGESAGGASVYHHIVSPLSKGLFHRAISQSGSSYAPWALAPPGFARANAEKLISLVGCPPNPQEAMSCMKKKDPKDVLSQLNKFWEWFPFPIQNFSPALEAPGPESFLTKPVSQWDHNPVPLMTGVSSGEGLLATPVFFTNEDPLKWINENFDWLAPYSISYFSGASNPAEVTKAVKKFYIGSDEITSNNLSNVTMAHGDGCIAMSVLDGANKHKGNVYLYYFDYLSNATAPVGLPQQYVTGANHGTDCAFIWNVTMPYFNPMGPEDTEVSKKLIKIIATFIKTGKPTIEGADWEWRTWTPNRHNYVNIDNKGFHLQEGLAEERYKFWKSIKYNDKFKTSDLQSNNFDRSEL